MIKQHHSFSDPRKKDILTHIMTKKGVANQRKREQRGYW